MSKVMMLYSTLATNFGGMVIGNGSQALNNLLVITNGSKLYIQGSDLFEVNRNTGAQGNKVLVTGTGSAWINKGTHAFALGGSSGNCTNAMVELDNGALWDLGASTFRLNYSGPLNSTLANASVITNVYSLIIGNGNYSNTMTIANGGKFYFSGASGDFREVGRGNNAYNNQITITDPNTVWNSGGSTITIGGTGTGVNNYSNFMTIANGAMFTNGSITAGGQGAEQYLMISNATAYINTLVVNGSAGVFLNGGSGDSFYVGQFQGNNVSGFVTNTATSTLNMNLGWNNGGQTSTTTPVIGGLVNLIKTGTGANNLQGANVFIGNILVAGGTLGSGSQQAATDGSSSAFGSLTNTGKTIIITNGGTLNLGNEYALLNGATPDTLPPITVYSGSTLNSSRFNALGQVTLNGGTLLQNSTDASPLNGYQFYTNITVGGSTGSAISVGTNSLPDDLYNAASGGTTFNVAQTLSGGADLTVSAGLTDYSNGGTPVAGSLTKTGLGVMLSTGTNSYTGLTIVQSGNLGLGSYSSQSGGITVNDGAVLDVTASGNSQIVPSTLTLGSSAGATIEFVNLANTALAPVNATNLTLNGTVTVNLIFPSITAGNQYPLITYTTIGGSGNFALNVSHGATMNLVTNNNGNGTFTIALNVTSPPQPTTDIWTGANSGNWDLTTANWSIGGNSSDFFNNDFVIFTNGTLVTNVTITTTVTPGSTTVNSASNYAITSSSGGHIAGTGGLNKGGSGMLTLTGLVNTYTGTNLITGGTVVVNAVANLGASTNSIVLNGGTLSVMGTFSLNNNSALILGPPSGSGTGTINVITNQTLTFGGIVANNNTGTGVLTKTGPGALSLSGANTYSGNTLVNGGQLIFTTAQQAGGAIVVSDTAALTVVASGGATLPTSSLTLGNSGSTTLTLQGVSGVNGGIMATNLIANGTVSISVIGAAVKIGEVPLVKYSTLTGTIANFTLAPTLPPNVAAVLTNDISGKFIGLVITSINGLTWSGINGVNWDIATTTNWLFGTTNTVYSDGSAVLFDDTGSKNVTINQLVSPSSTLVNNSTVLYSFSSATAFTGIGGPGGFIKTGPGTLNYLSVTNTYSGITIISNGTINLGAHPANLTGSMIYEFSTNSVFIKSTNAWLVIAGVGGSGTVYPQYISNSFTLDGGNIFATDGGQHLSGPINITANGTSLGDQQINKYLYLDGTVSGTGPIAVPILGGANDGIHTPGGSGYGGPNFTSSGNPYSGVITLYNGYIGIQDANGTCLANATLNLLGYNATFGQPLIWTANANHSFTLGGLAGTLALNLTEPNDGWYVALILGSNTSSTIVYSGALSDTSGSASVTKVGTDTQWLTGTNTYTSGTFINGGMLGISTFHAGNGSFAVADGAAFAVTNALAATNTSFLSALVSSLTLGSSGTTIMEFDSVNNTITPVINCSGSLTVNGTGTVKIIGTNSLIAGNIYPLITANGGITGSGGFTLSLPPGITANLVTNGGNTIALNVTSIASPINTNPTNITISVSGGNLTLSWPADHTGWRLQVQTNSLNVGLSTNWFTVANSTNVNSVVVPINPANASVFYQLIYP
jgi:fibronectin-binding autotransporter adhesin